MEMNPYFFSRNISILLTILCMSVNLASAFGKICSTTTTVTKGQNTTLGCDLAPSVSYISLYRGASVNRESTPLIEGNQTTRTLHQSNKFDITPKGDIMIYEAGDEDEGDYTLVVEYIDATNQEEIISVHLQDPVPESESDGNDSWKVPVVVTVSLVVLLVITGIVSVVIYILYYRNRDSFSFNKDPKDNEEDELVHLLLEGNKLDTKVPLNKRDENLQALVKGLEDYYKLYSYHELFPWKEEVETGRLLEECQCLVTSEDGKEIIVSSDKCLTQDILRMKQRISLNGEMGSGKSALLQKIVDEWRTDTNKTFVLFYIDLFNTSMDNCITDVIIEMIPETRMSAEEINRIIMKEKCIFILDNIPFLKTGTKSNQIEQFGDEEIFQKRLSVFDLLEGNVGNTDLPNLNVVAAFSRESRMNSFMPSPCLKIKLRGLNQANTNHYIEQTIEYFESLNQEFPDEGGKEPELGDNHDVEKNIPQETEELNSESIEDKSSQHEFIKRKNDRNLSTSRSECINQVTGFLRSNEIIEEFCGTPLWLTTVIHNKMASLLNIGNHEKNIEKVTSLTRLLVDCLLQRYLDRMPELTEDSIKQVFIELGKKCCDNDPLRHNASLEQWERSLDHNDIITALQIGILKIEKCSNGDEIEDGDKSYLLTFYHRLFMGYCIGKYVSEEQNVREKLKQYSNENLETFVNFISGSEQLIEEVFEELKDRKMWSNAIVYLYESHDMNEPIRVNDAVIEIQINEFKSRYHQSVLTSYLQNRNMRKCTTGTVFVDSDCSLVFLTSLCLPSIDTLKINERQLSEEDVQSVIDWASNRDVHCFRNIIFTLCRLPEQFDNLTQMKTVITDIKIQREESDGNYLQLDTCEGKWIIDRFV